jgi:hypothetical protein
MKIIVAVISNVFFSFSGFVLFLCLMSQIMPRGESGGWIGGGNMFTSNDLFKLIIFFSAVACIPIGLVNGLIIGFINKIFTAVLLASGLSLLFAPFFTNSTSSLKELGYMAIFFIICSLCNIATVGLLKWKFPDLPLNQPHIY